MTGRIDATAAEEEPGSEAAAWWAYGGPFALFGALTTVEGWVPQAYYPLVYVVKVCSVTAALVLAGAARRDIIPTGRAAPLAIVTGLAVFVAWVAIDTWVPYPHLGSRVGYDPFEKLASPAWAAPVFLAVRFYGLVVMVPVMEELFMRSFLLRYFTSPRFREIPMGTFSATAFVIVAALSAASHPEWLVAMLASAAYAWLLRHTRSLFPVVLAHAVTNAALGIYVVSTGDWKYW